MMIRMTRMNAMSRITALTVITGVTEMTRTRLIPSPVSKQSVLYQFRKLTKETAFIPGVPEITSGINYAAILLPLLMSLSLKEMF